MLNGEAALVGMDVAVDAAAVVGEPVLWSFDMVQDGLVEALDLWRRTPRVGHRALKSSWPNEMLQRIDAGDVDARGGDMIAPVLGPLPLSRAEVARRDAVSAWLEYVPSELNRRIAVLALTQLASGRTQICWRAVRKRLRIERGRGSEGRYRRAIGTIVVALNYPAAVVMVRGGAGPKAVAGALGLSFAEAHAVCQRLEG